MEPNEDGDSVTTTNRFFADYKHIQDTTTNLEKVHTGLDILAYQQIRRHWRLTLYILIGFVLYIAIIVTMDVLMLRGQFPSIYCWYDNIYKNSIKLDACRPQPEAPNMLPTPEEILLTIKYPPLAAIFNTFKAVRYLDSTSCYFLKHCLSYYGSAITPPMLAGNPDQLTGPNGETLVETWLPLDVIIKNIPTLGEGSGCKCDTVGLDTNGHICPTIQCALANHWNRSCSTGNPFFIMFRIMRTDLGQLFDIPSVKDYILAAIEDRTSTPGVRLKGCSLYWLYQGGLTQCAANVPDRNMDGLTFYDYMFVPTSQAQNNLPPFVPNCDLQAANTALNMALGFAMPIAALGGPLGEGAAAVSAIVGVTVGGIAGGLAQKYAKKECEEQIPDKQPVLEAAQCCVPNPNARCFANPVQTPKAFDYVTKGICESLTTGNLKPYDFSTISMTKTKDCSAVVPPATIPASVCQCGGGD